MPQEPIYQNKFKVKIEFNMTSEDIEDLEFFKEKLESAGLLSLAIKVSPFAKSFDVNGAKMMWNIITASEWDAWADLVSQINNGIRGVLRNHARNIRLKYVLRNDNIRSKFWELIGDSV